MLRAFVEVMTVVFVLLILTYVLSYVFIIGGFIINNSGINMTKTPANGIINAVNRLPTVYTMVIVIALTVAILYIIIKSFKPST